MTTPENENRPLLTNARPRFLRYWFSRNSSGSDQEDGSQVEAPTIPVQSTYGRMDPGPSSQPAQSSNQTEIQPQEEQQEPSEEAPLLNQSRSYDSLSNGSDKICLICLELLRPEEFESGDAMVLQCECKGDAALRHRLCAQKWVDIKGDLACDICQTPIQNLNAPRPRSEAGSQFNPDDPMDAQASRHPSASDVFDCIRMTWIVTIVCILFFNLHVASAIVTGRLAVGERVKKCDVGLLIAVMYTWSCQLLRCAQHHGDNSQANENNVQQGQNGEANERNQVPAIVIV